MKVYDLTAKINENLWSYGKPYKPFAANPLAVMEKNNYIATEFVLASHMGTHTECGRHWGPEKEAIDEIPVDKYIGKAKLIDLSDIVEPLSEITREILMENGGESLEAGDICVIRTDWDKYLTDNDKYVLNCPYINVDSAEYLAEKKVKCIAFDTPMGGDPRDGIDFVPENIELPDYVLYANGITLVLGLVNLKQLPKEFFFSAFPLNIEGADGTLVRAVAWTMSN